MQLAITQQFLWFAAAKGMSVESPPWHDIIGEGVVATLIGPGAGGFPGPR